jgi:hypothetical protein
MVQGNNPKAYILISATYKAQYFFCLKKTDLCPEKLGHYYWHQPF